ncbi:hypothetical protein BLA39750_04635 [Burkholderia lata]|uniref:Uncharacterized protein n=1 Tax=Burkholderia lata (strain ATCC 17760 / DSM 23089 / LMG 22485 / NCIMB 9086 / R18194 / 383) TaxID=482957 RepID=A0A6P2Z881_BURL3|nr:hypothetical protein BLA39750_04635 [Burkholderia lata]
MVVFAVEFPPFGFEAPTDTSGDAAYNVQKFLVEHVAPALAPRRPMHMHQKNEVVTASNGLTLT